MAAICERREMYHRAVCHIGRAVIVLAANRRSGHTRTKSRRVAVSVVPRRRGRRFAWKLTDAADWKLRSLCGLYGFEPMIVAMLALREHQDRPHDSEDSIVPEIWLTGPEGWGTPEGGRILAARRRKCLLPRYAAI